MVVRYVVKFEVGHTTRLLSKSSRSQNHTHKWTIFVRGINGAPIEQYVDRVVFYLQEGSSDGVRYVARPPYVVTETGCKGGEVPIAVFLKHSSKELKLRYEIGLIHAQSGESSRTYTFDVRATSEELAAALQRGKAELVEAKVKKQPSIASQPSNVVFSELFGEAIQIDHRKKTAPQSQKKVDSTRTNSHLSSSAISDSNSKQPEGGKAAEHRKATKSEERTIPKKLPSLPRNRSSVKLAENYQHEEHEQLLLRKSKSRPNSTGPETCFSKTSCFKPVFVCSPVTSDYSKSQHSQQQSLNLNSNLDSMDSFGAACVSTTTFDSALTLNIEETGFTLNKKPVLGSSDSGLCSAIFSPATQESTTEPELSQRIQNNVPQQESVHKESKIANNSDVLLTLPKLKFSIQRNNQQQHGVDNDIGTVKIVQNEMFSGDVLKRKSRKKEKKLLRSKQQYRAAKECFEDRKSILMRIESSPATPQLASDSPRNTGTLFLAVDDYAAPPPLVSSALTSRSSTPVLLRCSEPSLSPKQKRRTIPNNISAVAVLNPEIVKQLIEAVGGDQHTPLELSPEPVSDSPLFSTGSPEEPDRFFNEEEDQEGVGFGDGSYHNRISITVPKHILFSRSRRVSTSLPNSSPSSPKLSSSRKRLRGFSTSPNPDRENTTGPSLNRVKEKGSSRRHKHRGSGGLRDSDSLCPRSHERDKKEGNASYSTSKRKCNENDSPTSAVSTATVTSTAVKNRQELSVADSGFESDSPYSSRQHNASPLFQSVLEHSPPPSRNLNTSPVIESSKLQLQPMLEQLEVDTNFEDQVLPPKLVRFDQASRPNNCSALPGSDIPPPPTYDNNLLGVDQEKLRVLLGIQGRIMKLQDRKIAQQIADVISETGQFSVSKLTLDFDLFSLSDEVIDRLATCLQ